MTDAETPSDLPDGAAGEHADVDAVETPSDLPDGAAGEHADVDAVETPSDLPDDAATGHADVDAAVQRLADLDGLPVDQHGEVLDEIHGRLRDALTAAASPAPDRADG